jgi:AcrR family transcriptional regulator
MRTALAVFSRKGFEETSVQDICLASGYSKGGFYFHFRSKEKILEAILEQYREVLDASSLDSLAGELWALARRDEGVRLQLRQHEDERYERLLELAVGNGHNPDGLAALLNLLLLLDAGLRIRCQFLASSADDARRFVAFVEHALASPSTEVTRQINSAAG